MTKLFGRAAKLNVHGRVFDGLDFEFRVDRHLKASANTAEFSVYNLANETCKFLQAQKGGVIVEFRAGYKDQLPALPLVFLGQLREVTTTQDDADGLTQISSGDGDKEKKHPIAFSLGPGVSFENAVKKVVSEMGAGVGGALGALGKGKFGDASKQLVEGFTGYGPAGEELDRLLQSGGFEHSFQNGQLQILPRGKALSLSAVIVDQSSGLIGSPELGDKGSIKFRSLLNTELFPGRLAHVKSRHVDGFYRCERVVYSGQNAGNDWFADVEGKPVATI